jgi:hypothetical protein
MKLVLIVFALSILNSLFVFSQTRPYWDSAPMKGFKIYSISFSDSESGWAVSKLGEVLHSNDGGKHWKPDTNSFKPDCTERKLWCADIYCSIMITTNGGSSWQPYTDKEQEHFCLVYFKNNNTGWQTAEEFLNKVTITVNTFIERNEKESLIEKAHQCAEYFTNADSGWAVGWCVKNFQFNSPNQQNTSKSFKSIY